MKSARDKDDFIEHFERAFAKEHQERLPLVIDVTPQEDLAIAMQTGGAKSNRAQE